MKSKKKKKKKKWSLVVVNCAPIVRIHLGKFNRLRKKNTRLFLFFMLLFVVRCSSSSSSSSFLSPFIRILLLVLLLFRRCQVCYFFKIFIALRFLFISNTFWWKHITRSREFNFDFLVIKNLHFLSKKNVPFQSVWRRSWRTKNDHFDWLILNQNVDLIFLK